MLTPKLRWLAPGKVAMFMKSSFCKVLHQVSRGSLRDGMTRASDLAQLKQPQKLPYGCPVQTKVPPTPRNFLRGISLREHTEAVNEPVNLGTGHRGPVQRQRVLR